MRARWILVSLLIGALWGCFGESSTKPVETLDERTGITWAGLGEPIEFVQSARRPVLAAGERTSFAYLGPVEWNRSGNFSYGLWVHVAPGNDVQVGNIHAAGAVTLILDDGAVPLSPIEAPNLGREPYQPVVSWGQTAYFGASAESLKRIAASQKLGLDIRGMDNSAVSFTPSHDAHAALMAYVRERHLIGD